MNLLKQFIRYQKYCELLDLEPSKEGFIVWSKAVINHG